MLGTNSAANNSRLVQVTEQVFDPLRVPIAIGNEIYVVTQQDVRNTVDTRLISWEKLQGNNNLNNSAIQGILPCWGAIQDLINYILNVGQPAQLMPNFIQSPYAANMFNPPGLNVACGGGPPNQAIAPIQTQLDWEMRCVEKNPPNQFCHCKNTSTSDLKKVNFCIPKKADFQFCPKFRSRGVNITEDDFEEKCSTEPSAHEQLKQKKIMQSPEEEC